MSTTIQKTITFVLGLSLVLTLTTTFVPKAEASTVYYPNRGSESVEQMIARLYQLIAQLQQLQAQQNYNYGYTYGNMYGQVHGVSYYPSYGVNVETLLVSNTDRNSTTLNGRVSLTGSDYAYVWFEYGIDGDFDYQTEKIRINNNYTNNFSVRLYNLRDNKQYSFRAVVEDKNGRRSYGERRYFQLDNYSGSSYRDEEPTVNTNRADEISRNSARLRGDVDMNDFDKGQVFFVYGESRNQVINVEDENSYYDINENRRDLKKVLVDRGLNGFRSYWYRVGNLYDNTNYYFRLCVGYDNDRRNETLECGDVRQFRTN